MKVTNVLHAKDLKLFQLSDKLLKITVQSDFIFETKSYIITYLAFKQNDFFKFKQYHLLEYANTGAIDRHNEYKLVDDRNIIPTLQNWNLTLYSMLSGTELLISSILIPKIEVLINNNNKNELYYINNKILNKLKLLINTIYNSNLQSDLSTEFFNIKKYYVRYEKYGIITANELLYINNMVHKYNISI